MSCPVCKRELVPVIEGHCHSCAANAIQTLQSQLSACESNRDRFCKHINIIGDFVLGERDCHAPDAVSRETIALIKDQRATAAEQDAKYALLYSQVKDLADTIDAGLGMQNNKGPMERLSSQVAALLQCYIAERTRRAVECESTDGSDT